MPKKYKFCCLIVLTLVLSGCGVQHNQVSYTRGTNGPGGSVIISGLQALYLEYMPSQYDLPAYLYFVNPEFLGPEFVGITVEGDAKLDDGQITVAYTRDDDEDGTVFGASVRFVIDLERQSVVESVFIPWEEFTISLTEEEMIHIGTALGEVLQGAADYYNSQEDR